MKYLIVCIIIFKFFSVVLGETFYVSQKANNLQTVLETAVEGDSIIFVDNGVYDVELDKVKKGVQFFNALGYNAIINFYSETVFSADLSSAFIWSDDLAVYSFSETGDCYYIYCWNNSGGGTRLSRSSEVGSDRLFLAFDLSGLPAGHITEASLNLYNYSDNYNSSSENSIYIQVRNYTGNYNGSNFVGNDFYNFGSDIFVHENFYNYIGYADKQLITLELNSDGINYLKNTSGSSLFKSDGTSESGWKVLVMGFDVDFENNIQASSEFWFYVAGGYPPFLKIVYTPLQIIRPTANDRWRCGNTYDIQWVRYSKKLLKPHVANDTKIYYSLDGGATFFIIDSTDSDLGSYSWAIPSDLVVDVNENCKIKLVLSNNGNYDEIISETFAIIPNRAELELITPNGWEVYTEGDSVNIKWMYNNPSTSFLNKINNNLDSIFIWLSTNGGQTYQVIDSCSINGPQGDTSYLWTIPIGLVQGNSNDQCLIKILSEYNGQVFEDISDHSFSIYVQKSIKIVKPEDGEVILKTNGTYLIEWDYTGNISTVDLKYKKGYIWLDIGEFPASDRQYLWTIPASLTGSGMIAIFDKDELAIADTAKNLIFTDQISFDISYPTNNDTLLMGTNDSLKWSTSGFCDFVNIRLISDSYIKTYDSIPNVGVFYYGVPSDIPHEKAFFKICASFDSTIYANSDTFTVLDTGSVFVSDPQIDFGEIFIPDCSTHVFNIYNTTRDSVDLTILYRPGDPFLIEVHEEKIASGDSLSCKAVFCPQTEGSFVDSILLLAGTDTLKVYLMGISSVRLPVFFNYPEVRCITKDSSILYWKVNYPLNFLVYVSDDENNIFNTKPDTIRSVQEVLYTVSDLIPGTKYYFSIVPFINENIQFQTNIILSFNTLFKFIRKNIQFIEKPHVEYVGAYDAIVSFKSDFPIVGVLKLGEQEFIEDSASFIHIFKLSNLSPSTRYSYKIGVQNNGVVYYYFVSYFFKTLMNLDNKAPTLIKGPVVSVADNRASISFEADEACIASVELFKTAEPNQVDTLVDSVYSKKHTIIVVNLESAQSYTFYITLRDFAGNEYKWTGNPSLLAKVLNIAGGTGNFNTSKNADNIPPEFVQEPVPIMLYDSLFVLMYQANEQTIYNLYVYDQDENPVSYISNNEYGYVQKIIVPRLEPVQTYKVKLTIMDISGNENSYDDILIKTRKDNTPLQAKEVTINHPYMTDDFVLLSWTTDVYGDSKGLIDEQEDLSNYTEIISTDIDLQHILIVKNLPTATKYFYKLLSTDFYEQILYESDVDTFNYTINNKDLSFVKEPEVVYVNNKQVVIGWETNLLSNTFIEYYTDNEENKIVSSDDQLTVKHRIGLFNIDTTLIYHVKAISYTVDNQKLEKNFDIDMKSLNFEDTQAPPAPTNVVAELDTNFKINIEWDKVDVEDLRGYNIYRKEGNNEALKLLVKNFNGEKFIDDDLQENEEYIYGVSAVDISNNESEITFIANPIVSLYNNKGIIHNNIEVLAYPNPFNGMIRIQIKAGFDDEVELKIYNIMGELIVEDNNIHINSNERFIRSYNLSDIPTGLYFYKVSSEKNKRVVSGKIILLK